MQSINAQRRPHARADSLRLTPLQFGHQVGVSEVGPSHSHQVDGTGLHGVSGRGRVDDPGRVQER